MAVRTLSKSLICAISLFGLCAFGASATVPAKLPPRHHICNKSLTHCGLTQATVLAALKNSQAPFLQSGIDVRFSGDVLELAIWRKPADARCLKAESLDLADLIQEHFPGVFSHLDCCYFDPQKPENIERVAISLEGKTRSCTVSSEHTPELGEVYKNLSYREILAQTPQPEGSFAYERKELSDQLTTMKANGYDVNQAMGHFFAIEDLMRTRQYDQVSAAMSRMRQSMALAATQARTTTVRDPWQNQNQNTSVASSRTQFWQR